MCTYIFICWRLRLVTCMECFVEMQWPHVSALVPGLSSPGSSPGWGHCVVFLGKTLNSHSASISTQEYKWVPANCWGNLTNCEEVTCNGLAYRPGQVEILLATLCYRNWNKLCQLWASWLQDVTFLWNAHSEMFKSNSKIAGIAWDYYDGNQDQVTFFLRF